MARQGGNSIYENIDLDANPFGSKGNAVQNSPVGGGGKAASLGNPNPPAMHQQPQEYPPDEMNSGPSNLI